MSQQHLGITVKVPEKINLKRQDLSLIGSYAYFKGEKFTTKRERSKFFNKWLICSQKLLKDFGPDKCLSKMRQLKENALYDWNMSSIGKEIEREMEDTKKFNKMYPLLNG